MLAVQIHVFLPDSFSRDFKAAMKILITDGEGRSSLAATRSLGRKGCNVLVTGCSKDTLASCSRFCEKGVAVPDTLQNGKDYAKAICNIVADNGIDIVLPMTEQSIYLLNPVRTSLPGSAVLACPEPEKVQSLADKVKLYRLAERLGVAIPQTLYLENENDLPTVVNSINEYPVVIKPALSRIAVSKGFLAASVTYADSRKELEEQYTTNPALRYPSMIQEKIVGPGTGLFTLYDTDKHLALFSHRRLREKPPSGGVSVVSESVPLDKEMVEAANCLLASVAWKGVAMVEFKRDERDGRAKLIEINGRFWGSLQLAITCGIDFPALVIDYMEGKSLSGPSREYSVGHQMKWILGTLDHLLIRLKNTDAKLHLSQGCPSRFKAVLDFMRIWGRNTSFDVFGRDDFGPFMLEMKSYLQTLLKGSK